MSLPLEAFRVINDLLCSSRHAPGRQSFDALEVLCQGFIPACAGAAAA